MQSQRIYKNPVYVYLKKHYCPNCGIKLGIVKVKRVVNSESPEAIYFDFRT